MRTARWTRLAAVTALLLGVLFVAPVRDVRGVGAVRAAIAVLMLGTVTTVLLRQLRLTAADEDRRVDGLVAAVVLVVATFSYGFYALETHRPGQIEGLGTRLDALYFTCTTMLTVGYGDVHAVGQVARAAVLVQMVFDVVFVAAAGGLITSRARRHASRGGRRP